MARLGWPRLLIPPPDEPPGAGSGPERITDEQSARDWLEAERTELVATIRYAAEHDPQPAAWRLALELRGFFRVRRYDDEAAYQATLALRIARDIEDRRIECDALLALGSVLHQRDDLDGARLRLASATDVGRLIGYERGLAPLREGRPGGPAREGHPGAARHRHGRGDVVLGDGPSGAGRRRRFMLVAAHQPERINHSDQPRRGAPWRSSGADSRPTSTATSSSS